MKEEQVPAEHGNDHLPTAASAQGTRGQDTDGQVQDVAGHLAVPGGPAEGIVRKHPPRTLPGGTPTSPQTTSCSFPAAPGRPAGWRCLVTEASGAGKEMSGSARV